tara:strand:- start:3 stop:491 length:489 start_codon:yes stop_codon:yes gene_type:complete
VRKNLGFRSWYYLRVGWTTYFALIFSVVNTFTVTYFLAVQEFPIIKELFPSFGNYVVSLILIGIPILIFVGYAHFRKTNAYGSEAEIATESNPYFYKVAPGWLRDVQWPFFLKLSEFLIKSNQNEKLTDDELKELKELQKKMDTLIKGGTVGDPRKKNTFDD